MGVEVELVRDTLAATVADLRALEQEITIGVHADAEPYPDGTDAVMVARAQEFGDGPIPPRPFERGYFDSGGARELGDVALETIGKVIDGDADPEDVGNDVGETGVAGVRDYVEAGTNLDPLSPVTRDNPDRDPRGIPLLDTGHMLDQIDYEVSS